MVSPGSWVLRFEREKASVGSIRPSVRPSTFPVQTANQEQREQERGGGGVAEGEEVESEIRRKRERERGRDLVSMLEK